MEKGEEDSDVQTLFEELNKLIKEGKESDNVHLNNFAGRVAQLVERIQLQLE